MNNENNLILDNISDLCENIREYNNIPIKKLNIQSDKESKIINNKNTFGKRNINKIIYI